jgi:hypothetical protein
VSQTSSADEGGEERTELAMMRCSEKIRCEISYGQEHYILICGQERKEGYKLHTDQDLQCGVDHFWQDIRGASVIASGHTLSVTVKKRAVSTER